MSCCRAPLGPDLQLFRDLESVLSRLESRPMDRVMMDLTVETKKAKYDRILAFADRVKSLTEG